jgi:hypothetical protein
MISLEHAKRSDRLMRATTSLTVMEFEDLAQRFDGVWSSVRAAKTAAGTPRQRQCHRANENQPPMGYSKPATLR